MEPRIRPLAAAVLGTSLLLAWACAGAPEPVERPSANDPLGPGVHDVELGSDRHGETRTARVIWPRGEVRGALWIFHGGRDTGIDEMAQSWRDHRDRGWVLVFPQGQRQRPEEGVWFTPVGGTSPHIDPLLRLHDRLEASGVRTHVATGFSSGAHMTWRLACEQSERFDAFVPVAHYLRTDVSEACRPDEMRPILLIGMVDDPTAPYEGRDGPDGGRHNLGAKASLERMARVAGCTGGPEATPVKGGEHQRWSGCPLEHLRLERGGHRWPRRGADVVIDFAERLTR